MEAFLFVVGIAFWIVGMFLSWNAAVLNRETRENLREIKRRQAEWAAALARWRGEV